MTQPRPRLVMINAALGGLRGNTATALVLAQRLLRRRADVSLVTLAPDVTFSQVQPALAAADGILLATGTHWDGWSSLLQRFLEDATPAEGTRLWLGKPAACVVTDHSAGGKGVLSRLQGVLVTLGCEIPPMSGLVISRAALMATQLDQVGTRDFWSPDDLRVVCHNLIEAAAGTRRWRAWSVDRTDVHARWFSPPE